MGSRFWSALIARILGSIAVVFAVITIVFFMSRGVGDPISFLAPIEATSEEIEAIKEAEGLNDPILQQYGAFLSIPSSSVGSILSGAIVVETVFAWPGM